MVVKAERSGICCIVGVWRQDSSYGVVLDGNSKSPLPFGWDVITTESPGERENSGRNWRIWPTPASGPRSQT